MADLGDFLGRIAGIVDDNLLGQDNYSNGLTKRLNVELPVLLEELD